MFLSRYKKIMYTPGNPSFTIQEAHGPRVAHLSDIATADMHMCRKIDFQDGCHGGHLGYPTGKILAIFDLQVTPMSPTKFGVNIDFGYSLEPPRQGCSNEYPQSMFLSRYKKIMYTPGNPSFTIQEAHAPWVTHLSDIATADMQMCRKIDFQDGGHGGHLGFLIRTILAVF